MDLSYTPEEEAFRGEVKSFLAEKLTPELAAKIKGGKRLDKNDYMNWHRCMYEKGWVTPSWPKEHGGAGWTPMQRNIFDIESFSAGAPRTIAFGITMVGPVIINFGNDQQKAEHLPKIRNGEIFWCQGFSEPGSGSDLASLKTRAIRDGDDYIVNGQKTWTTLAQFADWIFCLVRTDTEVKKQEGISFLLIDMKTPGIIVRPIITLDGEHHVNEVFFEDVRVPVTNRVGEENKGWDYAKFLLVNERFGIAGVGQSREQLDQLKVIAQNERKNGKPLIEDPIFKSRVARVEIDLMALELTNTRILVAEQNGDGVGALSSILKIRGTEIQQKLAELQMHAVGSYATPWVPESLNSDWNGIPVGPDYASARTPRYLDQRKTSIYGGSNEIQKNIIAKAVLGL
jgi:alkylation response protein AidB-like acyl-CoA dehydrogenase